MSRLFAVLLLGWALAGCGTWTIRLEMPTPPDLTAKVNEVVTRVNEHDHRLDALEHGGQ